MIANYLSEIGFIGTFSTVNPMDHGKELEKNIGKPKHRWINYFR